MGFSSLSISHLSLEYVSVPLAAFTLEGEPYNPTGDTVQMAFMPQASQVPQSGDWQAAILSANPENVLYPYVISCLVGPGGTITLGIGTYVIYTKVIDNPQIPVRQASLRLEIF